MTKAKSRIGRSGRVLVTVAAVSISAAMSASADTGQKAVGENYIPAIWANPNGCDH